MADGELEHVLLAELRPLEKAADASLMHDCDPVADADDFLHVAGNHENAHPDVGQAPAHHVDVVLRPHLDAADRPIPKQQARSPGQPLRVYHHVMRSDHEPPRASTSWCEWSH